MKKWLQPLADAGHKLQRIGGWQRYLVAAGLGVLTATGFAPFYILPALVLGLTGLVLLLDSRVQARRPHWAAFFTGWAFGFGYFMAGMYWLAFAFLVQADQFAWMIPIAVPAFMAFLGLFFAGAAAAVSFWWPNDTRRVIALALVISLFEFARGTILTGLPWNLVGQAFAGSALLAQSAAWVGPYGLSLLVILIGVLPGACWRASDKTMHIRPLLISAGLMVGLVLFGAIRLGTGPVIFNDEVTVAIFQPNVPQRDKMDPVKRDARFQELLALTQSVLPKSGTAYAIWPENAYPFLAQAPDAPRYFATLFPRDTILLAGTYRTYQDEMQNRFANSLVVFGPTKDGVKPVQAVYDKHHLVPFGEYLPFKGLLKALRLSQLAPVEDGFSPGPGPQTLSVGPTQFAPLICYEDVFPRALYPANDRPDWLVTVTNDAWFGDNAGPKQHLDIARLRSIESGLPMARSANTGISALIGPKGRIIAQIPLYTTGSIVEKLPNAVNSPPYDRYGALFYLLLLAMVASALYRGTHTRSG